MTTGDTGSSSLDVRRRRAWHAEWPSAVALTIDYPRVPAWWLLERSATSFGSRIAVRELDYTTGAEGRITTYEALYRAARGTATGLQALGMMRGTRIGLVLPNSRTLIVGYYATRLAGGVVVPANPAAREGEIEIHLVDADVGLVVGEAGSAAEVVARRLGRSFLDTHAFEALATRSPNCKTVR